jgi:hypothetical protein
VSELAPGVLVAGRYAIVRLLGRGATKQVYLAEDKLAGMQVALALLIPEGSPDPTLAARFSREGKAASVLRSPFVVRVFDVGKLPDGTRYLANEAVLGRGLDEALSGGPVAADLAARWTTQVLTALSEAHARGIMHRDVKPENVLLEPTPGGEIARLTDFGLAKVLDGALEGSFQLRTAQNIVLGTPEYMAPEQWQGGGIDARTDLYAVGAMLHELVVGRPPFESKFLHALCVAHVTQPPPTFPAHVSDAARPLEPIVLRALAKRSEDRFESAAAMREAIERAMGFVLEVPATPTRAGPAVRCARAELLSDAFAGPVSLVATPNVVMGREDSSHIVLRCVPLTDENVLRTRTVSRQHARIDWRGGKAFITDLDSRTGTRVGDRSVRGEPVALAHGDVIAIGKHVQLRFEHAPATEGALPRWARLTRVDASGGGQTYVLVLTEAKFSSGSDAAVQLPASLAAGDILRVRAEDDGLVVVALGAEGSMPLQDGQLLRVGRVEINVAIA